MRKKVGIIKRVLCLCLIFLLSINSFAAIVSDNDGSAFITKAEFDALKSSFQSQIDSYNQSIDSKIDGAIASYLAGIKLASVIECSIKDYKLGLDFSGLDGIKWSSNTSFAVNNTWHQPANTFQHFAEFEADPNTKNLQGQTSKKRRYEILRCTCFKNRFIGTYGSDILDRVDGVGLGFNDYTVRLDDTSNYIQQRTCMWGDHDWNQSVTMPSGLTIGTVEYLRGINLDKRPLLKKIRNRATDKTYLANSARNVWTGGLVYAHFTEDKQGLNATTIAPRSSVTEYIFKFGAGQDGQIRFTQWGNVTDDFDATLPRLKQPTVISGYHYTTQVNTGTGHSITLSWKNTYVGGQYYDLKCDQCESMGVKCEFMLPNDSFWDWSGTMGGDAGLNVFPQSTNWQTCHYGYANQVFDCFDSIAHNSIKLADNNNGGTQYVIKDGLFILKLDKLGKLTLKGTASHTGYIYLYSADTKDTLGTGNASILTGTNWKLASHKISAGVFQYEQDFSTTVNKDIMLMFLPDSSTVQAQLTNLSAELEIQN